MAADSAAETGVLTNNVDSTATNGSETTAMSAADNPDFTEKFGFPLENVYKLGLKFFKEKEGSKAIQLSYKDRVRLVAYTKQVMHGSYRLDVSPQVGFLDVVGNDRRQAWKQLGELDRDTSMTEFVLTLHQLCPMFKAYVEAHKAEQEELQRKRLEEEERAKKEEQNKEQQLLDDEVQARQDDERTRQIQQEMAIRAALNQQTAQQFKLYAEQQCPNNPQQQEALIRQLQEQHFQQYMQQVYQHQLLHQQQQYQQLQSMDSSSQSTSESPQHPAHMGNSIPPLSTDTAHTLVTGNGVDLKGVLPIETSLPAATQLDGQVNRAAEEEEETENNLPPIAAASMWTRKDIKEFKESIRKDPDSLIKVGSGETVTVRVPTHEDGTCLFWEFSTDSYDIGFGVYFEWTIAPSNQVSVHVSESSDEDELEEEEGEAKPEGDLERGKKQDNRPPLDEIIPVYRRDCHEEVYCGSHMYPGRGVYLLKFDNSYSLWRSKTLYYRVYYTR